jgi:hypothetical protein
MSYRSLLLMLLTLLPVSGAAADLAALAPREVVSTAAVVDEGILYAASYELPGRAGHLRAFALHDSRRLRLWDAAEGIPLPGAALPPLTAPEVATLAPQFSGYPGERLIFTNLAAAHNFQPLTFHAQAAHALRPLLGTADLAEAAALINAVRGRIGTSAALPGGSDDNPGRLGAISRSSPALVGGSPFAAAAAFRDQVLYVGAEDGLLHAILAGRWSATDGGYDHTAADCGRELWAYLPGSLLPFLADAAAEPTRDLSPVQVDGSPAVSDLFFDSDGDGWREWRTVLVGTASVPAENRGVVFALDVTDPRAPRLLWETALAGIGLGRSRGAAIGRGSEWSDAPPRIYLTAGTATGVASDGSIDPANGSLGVLACALDIADGTPLWRFAAPYPGPAAGLAEPPSLPAVMIAASSGGIDGLVFGDLAGRLWALDPENGVPRGAGPLWQSPGGTDEPIGAGLTVRNRLVLFGTGGVETAAADRSYAVYAVEILPTGARLLWTHPLERGEKLWGAPSFDRFGRAFFGVGTDQADAGRLLVVAADGTLAGSVVLGGAPHGGLTLTPGAVVTVSRDGQVAQVGELRQEQGGENASPGRVRVLTWRVR